MGHLEADDDAEDDFDFEWTILNEEQSLISNADSELENHHPFGPPQEIEEENHRLHQLIEDSVP